MAGRRTEPLKPPPGFHFAPTDEELAFRILLRKKLNNMVPYDGIRDAFVYETHPEILTQKHEKWGADGKWYFFTTREVKYANGSRPARHTHDNAGYWRASGLNKHMRCLGNHFAVRKKLIYYLGNQSSGTRTNWVMDEILLVDENMIPVYSLALCTITRKEEDEEEADRNNEGKVYSNPFEPNEEDKESMGNLQADKYNFAYNEANARNQVQENQQIIHFEHNEEVHESMRSLQAEECYSLSDNTVPINTSWAMLEDLQLESAPTVDSPTDNSWVMMEDLPIAPFSGFNSGPCDLYTLCPAALPVSSMAVEPPNPENNPENT